MEQCFIIDVVNKHTLDCRMQCKMDCDTHRLKMVYNSLKSIYDFDCTVNVLYYNGSIINAVDMNS